MDGEIVAGQGAEGFGEGLYASAVRDEVNRKYIVKVVNLAHEAKEITMKFAGLRRKETLDGPVSCMELHSDDPYAENTLEEPQSIVPMASILDASLWNKNTISTVIGPRTFAVYTVEY